MLGDADSAKLLLDAGANLKTTNRDGSTPLHSAAFLGRAKVVAVLLEHGADANARSLAGQTPLETTTLDWDTTQFIARLLQIPVGTETDLDAGRAEVRRVLEPITQTKGDATQGGASAAGSGGGLVKAYRRFLDSDRWTVHAAGTSLDLIRTPVFHHLWFLWFLCWLVPIFAAIAWAAERLRLPRVPRGLLHTPVCYLWLLPLLFIPQWFMGVDAPSFGPDTSIGIVPMPHLLLYYGIFFGFGALYYDANDDEGRLGRRWWFLLPFALVDRVAGGPRNAPVASRDGCRAGRVCVVHELRHHGSLPPRPQARALVGSLHLRLVVLALPDPCAACHRRASDRRALAAAFARQVRAAPRRGDGDPPAVVSTFRSLHMDRPGLERPADASS